MILRLCSYDTKKTIKINKKEIQAAGSSKGYISTSLISTVLAVRLISDKRTAFAAILVPVSADNRLGPIDYSLHLTLLSV